MNQFIKGVVSEQLAKLIEDKEGLDDIINTHQKELKRLLPIQKEMAKDIEETKKFLATDKSKKESKE